MCGCVCACLSECLCVSNNEKCVHNCTFYIIKRNICKFKVCSIFSLCVIVCLTVVLLMQVLRHVLCTCMKVW